MVRGQQKKRCTFPLPGRAIFAGRDKHPDSLAMAAPSRAYLHNGLNHARIRRIDRAERYAQIHPPYKQAIDSLDRRDGV